MRRRAWIAKRRKVEKCTESFREGHERTTRGRGLGVSEQNHARLALLDQLLQSGLGAIIGLNFTAKSVEVDGVANFRYCQLRGFLGSLGLFGLLRVLRLLGLLRRLGFGGWLALLLHYGRRRRSFALAKFNHCERRSCFSIFVLREEGTSREQKTDGRKGEAGRGGDGQGGRKVCGLRG